MEPTRQPPASASEKPRRRYREPHPVSGLPRALLVLAVMAVSIPVQGRVAWADAEDKNDVSKVRASLHVVTDGNGHYIAFVPFSPTAKRLAFYGDNKTLHRLRPIGGASNQDKGTFEYRFHDPRGYLALERDERGQHWVVCAKRKRKLTLLQGDDAKPMLAAARLGEPLFKREAYALTRDVRGRYYYVDHLRKEFGGKGFRLYRGVKGAMKQVPLVDVTEDTAGTVLVTRSGELRLVTKGGGGRSMWVRGKRRVPLENVPIRSNQILIYVELGVYAGERFGTPCDDL